MPQLNSFRPTYCIANKEDSYFTLLKLARVSGWKNDDASALDSPTEYNRYYQALLELPALQNRLTRIIALIYQNSLRLNLFNQLPIDIQTSLAGQAQKSIIQHRSTQQELISLVTELTDQDISIILLKGTGYANTLYTNEAPRSTTDIDLLVKSSDFEFASELLSKTMIPAGIVPRGSHLYKNLAERSFKPTSGVGPTVDLHKQLTPPHLYKINEDILWAQSRTHPDYEHKYSDTVRLLSPEHGLLHQAVHAHKDMDFARHNLLDSHEILNQTVIDPHKLLKEASTWGAKNVLFILLNNCRQCMGSSISPELLDKLKPSAFKNLIIRNVLSSSRTIPLKGKPPSYRLLQIVSQLALPDKLSQGWTFQKHYLKSRFLNR